MTTLKTNVTYLKVSNIRMKLLVIASEDEIWRF